MGVETPHLGCRSDTLLCMSIDRCNRDICGSLIKWALEFTILHKAEAV